MSNSVAEVDLVSVGLNTTDTVIRIPHFPPFDTKVEFLSADVCPGGQVASAIVACQRWALRTHYTGKFGDDSAARFARGKKIPVVADLDYLHPRIQVLLEHIDYLYLTPFKDPPARLTGESNLLKALPGIYRKFKCYITTVTLGNLRALMGWQQVFLCPGEPEAIDL